MHVFAIIYANECIFKRSVHKNTHLNRRLAPLSSALIQYCNGSAHISCHCWRGRMHNLLRTIHQSAEYICVSVLLYCSATYRVPYTRYILHSILHKLLTLAKNSATATSAHIDRHTTAFRWRAPNPGDQRIILSIDYCNAIEPVLGVCY